MDDLRSFFFDAPGYGTQTDRRHFRLESEPGRGRSSGAERNRVGPNGANRETGEGDERAIYPVRRHVPPAGQNSRKSSIFVTLSFLPPSYSMSTVTRLCPLEVDLLRGLWWSVPEVTWRVAVADNYRPPPFPTAVVSSADVSSVNFRLNLKTVLYYFERCYGQIFHLLAGQFYLYSSCMNYWWT